MSGSRKLFTIMIASWMFLALAGCAGTGNGTDTPTTGDPTFEPQEFTVSALGEVVPEKWASLAFASGGYDLDVKVIIGQYVRTGDVLASVNDIAQKAAVANASSAFSSANASLETLQDLEASDDDILVAQKAVDAAQANLDQAQASLDATILEAPFTGVITDVFLRDFETVPPSQPVLILADLNSLVIQTTDLSEVDVARVQVQDPATVVFDALPDVTATGKVIRIALNPEAGAGTYYAVTIKLDEIPENLRWGMSAFVEIETSKASLVTPPGETSTQTSAQPPPAESNTLAVSPTRTASSTPTRTPRTNVPAASSTSAAGGGNPGAASPTFTWTSTSTASRTPTNSPTPSLTHTPQFNGSPTSTRPSIHPLPTPTPTP